MDLIPMPRKITEEKGVFPITPRTEIVLSAGCGFPDLDAALLLSAEARRFGGMALPLNKSLKARHGQAIVLDLADQSPQSYTLDIQPDLIAVAGGGSAGLFYGIQTLRQLIRQYGSEIPCLKIEDEPRFKHRGFYHDITRGKVPKLDTLKELADRASFYKLNQLQLYVEHTFAFKKMSEVWRGADPLTHEEILLFDEYCRKRHIELVPSLSTFGHLYHTLGSKSFRHLCELEVKDGEPYSWPERQRHHTIDVSNPESIALIRSMLDEYIPLFSSGKFNICCDETFDLGEGKNRDLAQKSGKARLYMDFLKQIIAHVKNRGKQVMFWGDIVLQHSEMLQELDADIICLTWNYGPDAPPDGVKSIAKTGLAQYVCPGVQGWNALMNDLNRAYDNIRKMVSYGAEYGAIGVLNTDWGDFGHINQLAASIPGMIYGAALSWNDTGEKDPALLNQKISRLEYGDETGRLAGILRDAGGSPLGDWALPVFWNLHKTFGIKDPWYDPKAYAKHPPQKVLEAYGEFKKKEREIAGFMSRVEPERRTDLDEFYISVRGLGLLHALGLAIQKYDLKINTPDLPYSPHELAEAMEVWLYDYSRAWRRRNKESELYRIRDVIFQICDRLREMA
ncbi:MAG: glycoside hydrolase family 20 zincin-like fold domain-containing protein [Bacillota bacterium]